jgi:hypothetical protein
LRNKFGVAGVDDNPLTLFAAMKFQGRGRFRFVRPSGRRAALSRAAVLASDRKAMKSRGHAGRIADAARSCLPDGAPPRPP